MNQKIGFWMLALLGSHLKASAATGGCEIGSKYFRTDEVEGAQARHDTLQADLQLKF